MEYINYMLRPQALAGEPSFATYGDAANPNVIFILGTVGDGTTKGTNRVFTIDTAKLEEDIKTLTEQVASDSEQADELSAMIKNIIAGTGLNEEGNYDADIDDNLLKKCKSINEAVKILSAAFQSISGSTNLKGEESNTLDIAVTKTDDGAIIKGNVKISDYGSYDPDFNDNILVKMNDGLFASVDLDYDEITSTLKFTASGRKEDGKAGVRIIEKQFTLGQVSVLDDVSYNSDKEVLILKFRKKDGTVITKEVPMSDIITEWDVENPTESPVTLKKTRSKEGLDKLSGTLKISSDSDNILKVSPTSGALFVKGTTDNILHRNEWKLDDVLDALAEKDEQNLSEAKAYTDAESNRARTEESKLQENINIVSAKADNVLAEAKAYTDAESQRAREAEADLLDKITNISDVATADCLDKAKAYTDQKFQEANSYADAKLVEAKEYADGKLTEAQAYADKEIAHASEITNNAIAAEKQRAESAEALLQNNINTLDGKVTELSNSVDQKITDAKAYTDDKVATVTKAVEDEKNRAEGVESEIKENVSKLHDSLAGLTEVVSSNLAEAKAYTDEKIAALDVSSDAGIEAAKAYADKIVETEKARAEGVETEIKGNVTKLHDALTGLSQTVDANVESAKAYTDQKVAEEKSRAEAAEKAIQDSVTNVHNEVTALTTTVEANLTEAKSYADQAVATEQARAEAAEKALSDQIAELSGNTSNCLEESKAYTDEKVAEVNTSIDAEKTRAEAAEKALDDKITATDARITSSLEEAKAYTDEKAVEVAESIEAEKARAEAAETSLDARITSSLEEAKAYTDEKVTEVQTALDGIADKIDVINGNEAEEGSIKNAIKVAKDYTDELIGLHETEANEKFDTMNKALQDEIAKSTISKLDTDSIQMVVSQSVENGTVVSANLRVSDAHGNIIQVNNGGAFATVDFNYDAASNTITFYNGLTEQPVRYQLNSSSIITDGHYDEATKSIILEINVNGVDKQIIIPAADLVKEWGVGRKPESVVILTKEKVDNVDTIFADVAVGTSENNLIQKVSGSLFASKNATDHIYSGTTTVKAKIDELDAAIKAEEARAKEVENAHGAAISSNTQAINVINGDKDTIGSINHACYLVAENMKHLINDETDRATGVENALGQRLDRLEGGADQPGSVQNALQQAKDYADQKYKDATAYTDSQVSGILDSVENGYMPTGATVNADDNTLTILFGDEKRNFVIDLSPIINKALQQAKYTGIENENAIVHVDNDDMTISVDPKLVDGGTY